MKLQLDVEGVDVDSKDSSGQTPLSWAIRKGYEAIVKLLLIVKGINPKSKERDYIRTTTVGDSE